MPFKLAESRPAQSRRRPKPRKVAATPRGRGRSARTTRRSSTVAPISPTQLKAAMVAILKERWGDDILTRAPRVMVGATSSEDSGKCDLFDIDVDELIARARAEK
jgi:hypothetical protein